MSDWNHLPRREFLKQLSATGAAVAAAGIAVQPAVAKDDTPAGRQRKIRVGVIGCGNVSGAYLPNLLGSPFVEVVSVCDIIPERAEAAAKKYKVPNFYPHIDKMLAGADFDLLVNLTSMPAHFPLNKAALQAGKHVWTEKPMASSVGDGKELLALAKQRSLGFGGAPTCVTSPQFRFMAETLAGGKLGRVCAAHASYGHLGPTWSAWFFQKGGGCLYDLGVYNITTLTGLLGPAKEVVGLSATAIPVRHAEGRQVKAEADDNTMLLIDHGNAVFSHIQTGFVYFTALDHRSTERTHHTMDIMGTEGSMHLRGYDWGPHGVDMGTRKNPEVQTFCAEPGSYKWEYGASYVAECLATGKKSLMTAEHALHVLEIMNACHESQQTGRRIKIDSSFSWPIIQGG
ncbi:MAG: Gfo/Idh/MocA family oxidoreductase [Planctomycetota bacterium]|nr:Gfo/Idh/MocA family oxidoreductase [Planctomycetota bacterium]